MNSSITDKCPGDVISVLCSTTNNDMEWVWQSNYITEKKMYSVDLFSDDQLNVPHTFSIIQSVTTTLLNYSTHPLYLKSCLQYVISGKYPEATIECKNFVNFPSKTIQVTTKSKWPS